jgi:hypothetical protein
MASTTAANLGNKRHMRDECMMVEDLVPTSSSTPCSLAFASAQQQQTRAWNACRSTGLLITQLNQCWQGQGYFSRKEVKQVTSSAVYGRHRCKGPARHGRSNNH